MQFESEIVCDSCGRRVFVLRDAFRMPLPCSESVAILPCFAATAEFDETDDDGIILFDRCLR